MRPSELFEAGDLAGARQAATEAVKSQPSDISARTFLFELLCFDGEFDRALIHLDAVAKLDTKTEPAVQVYKNLIAAEKQRALTYSKLQKPEFLRDEPAEAEVHLKAIGELSQGRALEARTLLERSGSLESDIAGNRAGQEFAGIRDCDDILAPFLEFMVIRDYVWVPFSDLREIEIGTPERPRDLLWVPTRLVLADGSQRRGYIPTTYPNSQTHEDPAIRMGRSTDWIEEGGIVRGVGHRMILAGDEGHSLLGLGRITLSGAGMEIESDGAQ